MDVMSVYYTTCPTAPFGQCLSYYTTNANIVCKCVSACAVLEEIIE